MNFDSVIKFETAIAGYFNSPFAVATDCCTHAVELCLRYNNVNYAECPEHTYVSIPMTFKKLGISWKFKQDSWKDYYYVTDNIIDAAVFWKENGYIDNTFMCLSFQFKKYLSLGRGGMILCNNLDDYVKLKKMSYDGRDPGIPWAEQNIDTLGYHYYMTPETAQLGLDKFSKIKNGVPSKEWNFTDYPYLPDMEIFK